MKFKATYQKLPGLDAPGTRIALVRGNEAMGDKWVDDFLERHFEEEAMRRYGYQKRSGSGEPPTIRRKTRWAVPDQYQKVINSPNPKYLWRKKREKGHTRPLVYSARSAAAAKLTKIDASSRRGSISFPAMPRYFWKYLKAGTYLRRHPRAGQPIPGRKGLRYPDKIAFHVPRDAPDKGAELVTLIDSEMTAMHRAATDAAMAAMLAARNGKTVRIT